MSLFLKVSQHLRLHEFGLTAFLILIFTVDRTESASEEFRGRLQSHSVPPPTCGGHVSIMASSIIILVYLALKRKYNNI